MTAIQVFSEIGGDMFVFLTVKHLVSWAGCCPRNDQSNKKSNQLESPVLVHGHNLLVSKLQKKEIAYRMYDNAFLETLDIEATPKFSDRIKISVRQP